MTRTVLAVLLPLLLAPACAPPAEVPTAAAAAAVRVAAVERGSIDAVLSVSGETDALRVVRLSSPVAGRITELAAQPGDRLDAGAPVARVLPTENEAALHGLDVLDRSGVLAAPERPAARRLARAVARQAVIVRAPFAGLVAARLHNPDEQVVAGEPLLELFDPASLVVLAQVPVDASAQVRPGMRVEMRLGAAVAQGAVNTLVDAVSPQVLTVPVRIDLAAPLRPPLLHAAVDCRIVTAHRAGVLVIPAAALLPGGSEGVTVMVAVDGRAQRRAVRLGVREGERVEVVAGLTEGELLIIEGAYGLPDGAAIAPQPSA